MANKMNRFQEKSCALASFIFNLFLDFNVNFQ